MSALTTTHVIAQKRDGRAFDEVSDAVDEGRSAVLAAQHPSSRRRSLPVLRIVAAQAEPFSRSLSTASEAQNQQEQRSSLSQHGISTPVLTTHNSATLVDRVSSNVYTGTHVFL